MNRLLYLVFAGVLLISTSLVEAPRGSGYRIRTVVIDAGHGGHDSGCLGSSAKEKFIALDIALKMGKMIEEKYPEVKVIYTRKTDVFIPLFERAEIANRNKADLFICIHCNAAGKPVMIRDKKTGKMRVKTFTNKKGKRIPVETINPVPFGSETYVMGLKNEEGKMKVAQRENSAILLEDNYKKQYDGFDPNSPEANIIFSLYQNQFMNQSLSFASRVQNQVDEYAGRYNRGVKQAGFLVLYKTAMPSVLIEAGFLTHDQEERFLQSDKGQTTIANCVFRAFKEYKLDMEDVTDVESTTSKQNDEKTVNANTKPEPDKTTVGEIAVASDTLKAKENKILTTADSIASANSKVKNTDAQNIAPKESQNKSSGDSVKSNNTASVNAVNARKPVKDKPKNPNSSKVFFAVQIGASNNAAKDLPKYMHIKDVHSVKGADGFVRFLVGNFKSLEDARTRLAQLKNDGYKDAFIAAYNGDQRITVNEANELLK